MRKLFYLAHPVSGDTLANCERAKEWLKFLFVNDPDNVYIAPWIAEVQCFPVASPEVYDRALADDVEVVRHCDGIILTGGMISRGMQIELDAARASRKTVIDCSMYQSPLAFAAWNGATSVQAMLKMHTEVSA